MTTIGRPSVRRGATRRRWRSASFAAVTTALVAGAADAFVAAPVSRGQTRSASLRGVDILTDPGRRPNGGRLPVLSRPAALGWGANRAASTQTKTSDQSRRQREEQRDKVVVTTQTVEDSDQRRWVTLDAARAVCRSARRRVGAPLSKRWQTWRDKRRWVRYGVALFHVLAGWCVAFKSKCAWASGGGEGGILAAGPRRDALVLLACAAILAPTLKNWGASPILGFLAAGTVLGPDGLGVVSQVNTERALADLGVAIFLFEMGLGLSLERLNAMRREIFGLGVAQYTLTTAVLAACLLGTSPWLFGALCQSATERFVVGGALALSSSAFALQLLRDRDELATNHGRSSLGVLLFQDIAVIPLLVAMPILGGAAAAAKHSASMLATSLGAAAVKAGIAIGFAEVVGKRVLDGLFYFAAKSRSQEAFLSVVLLTVIGMSALTEVLGLSATLGAFLAGVALSETRYRYQVEADVAPFRGMLLGLFFVTAGFSIDLKIVASQPSLVFGLAGSILAAKSGVLFSLAKFFRKLPASAALRVALLLAPGGEFSFVALGSAATYGVVPERAIGVLQTTTALTMASTPLLNAIGARLSPAIDRAELRVLGDLTQTQRDDADFLKQAESDNLVVVCGYGRVGRVVCELLDAKFVDYVAFDLDPTKATAARERGKPVFFGDLGRPEVLEYFRVGDAKMVVVAVNGQKATNRVVVGLKKKYPNLQIIARAADEKHRERLKKLLGVVALVPAIPENSRLLSLPFAGAVLKALDYNDVDLLIEESRRSALGLYDGMQSATLFKEEQEAIAAQLGDDDAETTTESSSDEESSDFSSSSSSSESTVSTPTPTPATSSDVVVDVLAVDDDDDDVSSASSASSSSGQEAAASSR